MNSGQPKKLDDKNVDLFYQKLREAEERQKEAEKKVNDKRRKRWSWNFGNVATEQKKLQEAREKAIISGPVSVQHEGHLGFNESGKLEMKNLPPAWQSIVESLNKTLRSLGENELTRDEFAFLVSKFNEVPQTVKEAKAMTIKQNSAKQLTEKKKKTKEELEVLLEETKKKSKQRAQKIRNLQTERAVLVGKNQRLEEAKQSLEQNVATLEEAKKNLELELSELQMTYATTKKSLESQLDLANKRLVATTENYEKKLHEEQQAKAEVEKANENLKLDIEKLNAHWKGEVLAAMKADVKAQKLKDDAELAAMKKSMQEKYDDLNSKFKQERQMKEDLDKRRIELENKVADLQVQLDNHNMKEVDLAEMKKNFFKELQNVKGQMLAEMKKAKAKWESERQARERAEAKLQLTLRQGSIAPLSGEGENKVAELSSPPPVPISPSENTKEEPVSSPPPPPVATAPSNTQNSFLSAIANTKLRKAEERKEKEEVALPSTKSLEQNSVADVLAYAILARRTNIEQKTTIDEEESDEEDWE